MADAPDMPMVPAPHDETPVAVPAPAPWREGRLTAHDGLTLAYRDYPPAPGPEVPDGTLTPILCLAGLSRNAKDFDDPARHLCAAGRRVICPDYRGRGRSARDPDWRNYQARIYLDDIRHLLTALNLHRVVVIGTSLGGILAMAMGAAMPGLLAGVVLNDIGPDVSPGGLARIRHYLSRNPVFDDWPAAIAHLKTIFGAHYADDAAGWQAAAEATFHRDADGRLRCDWDPAIVRSLDGRTPMPDLWPLFRSLRRVPVLAIRGALSDILTPETLARMGREKPDLQQVEVPDKGHVPLLTERASRRALDDFLQCRGKGGL